MIGCAIRRKSVLARLSEFQVQVTALVVLLVLAAVVLSATLFPVRGPANAATMAVPITPARASRLIEATTGDAVSRMQATGDQAKLINASLPFASGPLPAARPFVVSGQAGDKERALLCLTQAVYYEAGFESVEGRRAVAQVVLNRMRHPAFPKSVCGVVYQSNGRVCQFTFACDGALNRAPAGTAWRQAAEIARSALAGYVERSVGSATHYHADYVAPRWAPLLAKVAKLGQHVFYRWPGSWGQSGAFTGRYIGEPRDPIALRSLTVVAHAAPSSEALPAQALSVAPAPRAVNDIGGLLDTSKGWTLKIPGPDDGASAAAEAVAAKQAEAGPDGRILAAAAPAAGR